MILLCFLIEDTSITTKGSLLLFKKEWRFVLLHPRTVDFNIYRYKCKGLKSVPNWLIDTTLYTIAITEIETYIWISQRPWAPPYIVRWWTVGVRWRSVYSGNMYGVIRLNLILTPYIFPHRAWKIPLQLREKGIVHIYGGIFCIRCSGDLYGVSGPNPTTPLRNRSHRPYNVRRRPRVVSVSTSQRTLHFSHQTCSTNTNNY